MNDNLDFLSLRAKDINNDEINFLSNQYVINNVTVPIIGTVYVEERQLCRLDGIYQRQYGTMLYFDLFLKFNQINDPLGVPIGTKILLPDLFALKEAYELVSYKSPVSLNTEKIYIGSKKLNKPKTTETATNTRSVLKDRGKGYTIDSGNGKLIF